MPECCLPLRHVECLSVLRWPRKPHGLQVGAIHKEMAMALLVSKGYRGPRGRDQTFTFPCYLLWPACASTARGGQAAVAALPGRVQNTLPPRRAARCFPRVVHPTLVTVPKIIEHECDAFVRYTFYPTGQLTLEALDTALSVCLPTQSTNTNSKEGARYDLT